MRKTKNLKNFYGNNKRERAGIGSDMLEHYHTGTEQVQLPGSKSESVDYDIYIIHSV